MRLPFANVGLELDAGSLQSIVSASSASTMRFPSERPNIERTLTSGPASTSGVNRSNAIDVPSRVRKGSKTPPPLTVTRVAPRAELRGR